MFCSVCNTMRQSRNLVNFMRGVRVPNIVAVTSLPYFIASRTRRWLGVSKVYCSFRERRSFLCLARAATTYSIDILISLFRYFQRNVISTTRWHFIFENLYGTALCNIFSPRSNRHIEDFRLTIHTRLTIAKNFAALFLSI